MRWLPIEQADKSKTYDLYAAGVRAIDCVWQTDYWRTARGKIVLNASHFLEIPDPTDDASAAQDESVVTDAMVEAALAIRTDHFQCFNYGQTHVIRDLSKPVGLQEIWRQPKAKDDDLSLDAIVECERIKMRLRIEAALHAAQTKETGE